MHHFDIVACALRADVGAAGILAHMGGNGGQEGGGKAVGLRISAGHQGGAVAGALLAAGDAHAQEMDAGLPAAELAGLGLRIMGVSAVDHDVSCL